MLLNELGGPAFPVEGHLYGDHLGGQLHHGMTLWDYYAAAALAGMLGADEKRGIGIDAAASYAGLFADAMLAERRKRLQRDGGPPDAA